MLQLHRRGKLEEWELQRRAREYIGIYKNKSTARVPFRDVTAGKIRYVVFEYILDQWVFLDIPD